MYSWGSPSCGKIGFKEGDCVVEPRNVEKIHSLRKKELVNKKTDQAGIAIESPSPLFNPQEDSIERDKREIEASFLGGSRKKKPEFYPVHDVACGRYNSLFVINSKVYSLGFKHGVLGIKPRKGKDLQVISPADVK